MLPPGELKYSGGVAVTPQYNSNAAETILTVVWMKELNITGC